MREILSIFGGNIFRPLPQPQEAAPQRLNAREHAMLGFFSTLALGINFARLFSEEPPNSDFQKNLRILNVFTGLILWTLSSMLYLGARRNYQQALQREARGNEDPAL